MLIPVLVFGAGMLGREKTQAILQKSMAVAFGPEFATSPAGRTAVGAVELGVVALALRKMPLKLAALAGAKLIADAALADPAKTRAAIARLVDEVSQRPVGQRARRFADQGIARVRGAVGGDAAAGPTIDVSGFDAPQNGPTTRNADGV